MALTDDSHTLNPAPPRPPTREGPGSTSRLPKSQAPTEKSDSLNPGPSLYGQLIQIQIPLLTRARTDRYCNSDR